MTIRVLVLEDDDLHFNGLRDAAEKDAGSPAIEIVGRARTYAELMSSLDHNPDVVLIDDYVPLQEPGSALIQSSIHLVAEMTRRLGSDTPLRILWSGNLSARPLTSYTFIAFGGHNCIEKQGHVDEHGNADMGKAVIALIRDTVNGARWEPQRRRLEDDEDDKLVRRYLRQISMLAAGRRAREIAAKLDTDHDNVSVTTSKIAKAFGLSGDGAVLSVVVPEAAERFGYLYVPWKYWSLSPYDEEKLWPYELRRGGRRHPTD